MTNKVIVIGTTLKRSAWVNDCLASLVPVKNQCSIIPFVNPNWELSVIRDAASLFSEFIFLPDSTIVLDAVDLVYQCFDVCKGFSVSLSQFPCAFGMYLGKYISSDVLHTNIPEVHSKLEAVKYESEWTKEYATLREYKQLGTLEHTTVFEERHGRLNMVTESKWLRRYKGAWDHPSMMRSYQTSMDNET